MFLWKKWYKCGIVNVKDIVKKGFKFMDISEIKNKFSASLNWFEYYKLISAIPAIWKSNFSVNEKEDEQPFVDHVFSILEKRDCNKIIRESLLEKVYVLPNRIMEKWNNLIVDHGYDWVDIFRLAFKCAIDSKTRNFQFKTLHRIIATNDFLYKVDIVDNNLCTFCDLEIETLEHLFYHCILLRIFGKMFLNGSSLRMNARSLSQKNIFFLVSILITPH